MNRQWLKKAAPAAVLVAAVLVAAVLTACEPLPDDVRASAQQALTVQYVVHSRANAGGQMAISHRLPAALIAGQPATVLLRLQLDPSQLVTVEINDSDAFQLLGDTDYSTVADDSGVAAMEIQLLPLRTGTAYLQLLAASVDGTLLRSYAIRLDVADATGRRPEQSRVLKPRIDLPSSTR